MGLKRGDLILVKGWKSLEVTSEHYLCFKQAIDRQKVSGILENCSKYVI